MKKAMYGRPVLTTCGALWKINEWYTSKKRCMEVLNEYLENMEMEAESWGEWVEIEMDLSDFTEDVDWDVSEIEYEYSEINSPVITKGMIKDLMDSGYDVSESAFGECEKKAFASKTNGEYMYFWGDRKPEPLDGYLGWSVHSCAPDFTKLYLRKRKS